MNLRLLNRSILGLFVGYLNGQILVLILRTILQLSGYGPQGLEMLQSALFLLGVCLGCFITFRAADEFSISIPFVKFIHSPADTLKPSMQAGEKIKIKVQRYGKEPRQGVGYLEDGAMVVINGGGDYIGEMVEALVLSVKHTSSGRMVFCNTLDGEQNES